MTRANRSLSFVETGSRGEQIATVIIAELNHFQEGKRAVCLARLVSDLWEGGESG